MAESAPTSEITPTIPPANSKPEQAGAKRGNFAKRATAAGLVGIGMTLGAIGVANAETPTPPPTKPAASGTPNPNANATEIAGLQAAIEAQKKQNADQTKVAELRGTATALAESPTPTRTPTKTPTITTTPTSTPSPTITLTPNATATEALFQANRTAVVQAAIDKEKLAQTSTPTKTPPPTRTSRSVSVNAEPLPAKPAIEVKGPDVRLEDEAVAESVSGAAETVSNIPTPVKVATASLAGLLGAIGALLYKRNRRGGGGTPPP